MAGAVLSILSVLLEAVRGWEVQGIVGLRGLAPVSVVVPLGLMSWRLPFNGLQSCLGFLDVFALMKLPTSLLNEDSYEALV